MRRRTSFPADRDDLVGRELVGAAEAPDALDGVAAIVDRRDHVGDVRGDIGAATCRPVADHEPVIGAGHGRGEPQPAEPVDVRRPEDGVLETAVDDDLLGEPFART